MQFSMILAYYDYDDYDSRAGLQLEFIGNRNAVLLLIGGAARLKLYWV